jgi:hypothetical protein
MRKTIKNIFGYVKVYLGGVMISTAFVLYVNDLFYYAVFKNKAPIEDEQFKAWDYIKPREIFGQGAKSTFIKHKIEEEKNDESIVYQNYLSMKKRLLSNDITENKKI